MRIVYVQFDPPPGFDCCELIEQPTNIASSITGIAPSPIVVSPSMESCFLPIELCEKVMDAIPEYVEFSDIGSGWPTWPQKPWDSQQALCACALTCHAWRVRAQYLLWTFPSIIQSQQFPGFSTAIRKSLNTSTICGLALGSLDFLNKAPASNLSMAGELFMHSFPHLQILMCECIRFERGPPLRVLRMRPPFFDRITSLELFGCTFQSFRAMLDVVWACSNLATLVIGVNEIESKHCSAAGLQNLCTAAENLRACRKLTRLWLDTNTIEGFWSPAHIGLSGIGRVFGYAVTELIFISAHRPDAFIILFKDSFPALCSVTVWFSGLDENPELPSWLHIIATGRPIPGVLKTIVLQCDHWAQGLKCCGHAVGTREEVGDSAQCVLELLPELEELVLRLEECRHPARHAAYIWDVLPGLRNVLRFEYREDVDEDWRPYTVLQHDVPRLLAQDTDSDSDSDSDSESESD
ncbi:hypothetical protein VTO73DRAFT_12967 [Trametes versicolor]